jgi:hypothetical protein
MNRAQLEHAIRAACDILQHDSVIIIGSQSILGTHADSALPLLATMSDEVDVRPQAATAEEVSRLADDLEGVAGELSQFHATFGFYIDGVDEATATLPPGWEARLVPISGPGTDGHTGLCLDPHDLCVAKLIAYREKDRLFVASLIAAQLIDPYLLLERVTALSASVANRELALDWLLAR